MYTGSPVLMLEREAGLPEHAGQVAVAFYLHPRENKKESAKHGRPMFDEVEYIQIQTPGERNTIVQAPAAPRDRLRFPKAYARFKAGETQAQDGTPLEVWPQMTRALVLSFKAIGIHTVDALAEVNDANIEALGHGGREFREKARAFVKQAADTAEVARLAAETLAKDGQIQAMQSQINDLCRRIEAAEAGKGRLGPSEAPALPGPSVPPLAHPTSPRAARQRQLAAGA
jgi:hypothetical protein